MVGLFWFLAGGFVGLVQALTLFWTVETLHPERPWHATLVVWVGTLLRAAVVVAVVITAIRQSLTLGLLALAGFFVSRTVGIAIMSSRMAHRKGPSE